VNLGVSTEEDNTNNADGCSIANVKHTDDWEWVEVGRSYYFQCNENNNSMVHFDCHPIAQIILY